MAVQRWVVDRRRRLFLGAICRKECTIYLPLGPQVQYRVRKEEQMGILFMVMHIITSVLNMMLSLFE